MGALHPWIAGDLMYFLNTLPYLEVMYEEFGKCMAQHHHDDIPDNFSYQPRYAPSMMQAILTQETDKFSRPDGAWQYLFDTSGEMYGQASNYYTSPFQGMLLTNDPENPGVLRWQSNQIENPLVSMMDEDVPVNRENGLDSVLGLL
jgi:hypothetical protein